MARTQSFRISASSSTQSSGGSPPFDSPSDMLAAGDDEADADLGRRDLVVDSAPFWKTYAWSKTVVQPDAASSASPMRPPQREASGVRLAQTR